MKPTDGTIFGALARRIAGDVAGVPERVARRSSLNPTKVRSFILRRFAGGLLRFDDTRHAPFPHAETPFFSVRISLPNYKTVLPFLYWNLGCGPASAATATFLHFEQTAFSDEAIEYEPSGDSPSSHAVNV